MEPLAKPAIDVVNERRDQVCARSALTKTYLYWMENIRDWCISRQLWWGHRIPAYYCRGLRRDDRFRRRRCTAARSAAAPTSSRMRTYWTPGSPPRCGRSPRSAGRTRPTSSKYFYPTNALVTGYDIIFFWVARMMFSGLEHMGEVPFNTCLYPRSGARRAGQKDVASRSATASTRWRSSTSTARTRCDFTLATGNAPGNDMRFSDEAKVQASPQLCKQALERFPLRPDEPDADETTALRLAADDLAIEDKWVLTASSTRWSQTVTDNLDQYELGVGGLQAVRLHLGHFLRLVYRADKDPSARRRTTQNVAQKVLCLCAEATL